jgi:hypothetical protein
LAAVLLGSAAVFAQEGGAEQGGEGPGRRMGRRFPGQRMDAMRYVRTLENFEQEVIRGLEADEELTQVIHDLFAKHLAPLKEQVEQRRQGRRDSGGEVRELMEELREAQSSGDTERAQELRGRLAEMRQQREEYEQVHEALFDEIRSELLEEELARFDALAERFESRIGGDAGRDDMQRIRQALAGVNLSPEQRTRVRDVIREHARREMSSEDRDPRKAQDRSRELRDAITAELDEEQAAQFEKAYAELEQREKQTRQQAPGAATRRGPAPREGAVPGAPVEPPADEAAPDDGGHGEEAGHAEPPE